MRFQIPLTGSDGGREQNIRNFYFLDFTSLLMLGVNYQVSSKTLVIELNQIFRNNECSRKSTFSHVHVLRAQIGRQIYDVRRTSKNTHLFR